MTEAVGAHEARVREVLEGALGRPLGDWPADAPLAGFPSAAYDSLMQLEFATRLEQAFGLETGSLDTSDVTSLEAATARLSELVSRP
ncbi:acyl carrier protein [Streptomyces sp. NPDC048337]|uniref:acyl carrier protein n=1 Tax=Streptomyces sp. NPDC048337 TaxID=3365535 RepID=UPI00371091AD